LAKALSASALKGIATLVRSVETSERRKAATSW